LPEWTWYNIILLLYCAGSAKPVFDGQKKAADAPVVWSKFAIGKTHQFPVSARVGMLAKYIPSFSMVTYSLFRSYMLESGLGRMELLMLVHFGKRILEVLFLHSFSGSPTEDLMHGSLIGVFYLFSAYLYCRDGAQATGAVENLGLALFVLGVLGNFYHHFLLARLRKDDSAATGLLVNVDSVENSKDTKQPNAKADTDDSGKYKIPLGGLFDLVVCPHYLFEIVGWWGAAIQAFSLIPMMMALNTTLLLTGHSLATLEWYKSKFGSKWPSSRKSIIPFVL
jgi:very-long-chain enoyl-CoA reductase